MTVSRKLALALTSAILVVLGLHSAIRIWRELDLFESDSRHDDLLLGRAVAAGTQRLWHVAGEAEALHLVDEADARESHLRIRFVWLEAPDGDPVPLVLEASERSELQQGRPVFVRRPAQGDSEAALYTFAPVRTPDGRMGAIELRDDEAAQRLYLQRTLLQNGITTMTLVALCGVLAVGLGSLLVGRPVRELVAHARRVGAGDLTSRLELSQRDEMGALAAEMNAMSDRLAQTRNHLTAESAAKLSTLEQLRHADRLTTVGKLAAGIAHEIGTPLNVISGHAQLIAEEPVSAVAKESAAAISTQALRVATIVRQLLDFARKRPPLKQREDLTAVARRVAGLLEPLATRRGVKLSCPEPTSPIEAEVDAGQLEQVLTNLVVNAVHACQPGGAVEITSSQSSATPPGHAQPVTAAWLRVRDDGRGMSEEVKARVFEPFFTTKDIGEGTGLGLSVAYGIVREHGGWLEVESAPGQGSCFSIWLPRDETAA